MVEYLRELSVKVYMDTNKRTEEATFEDLDEALGFIRDLKKYGPLDAAWPEE